MAQDAELDRLKATQDAAFSRKQSSWEAQSMVSAFNRASSAHDMRDGASAKMYANEGHAKKAEAQGYVAERRRLVAEIRSARERHEATKPAFQSAKAHFSQVKNDYDRTKEEHQQKQAKFQEDKAAFERAKEAFQKRLEVVHAQSKQRKDEKRALAEKAGVPFQYRDNVYVSRQPDGTINIYFGGVGTPDGLGHGHYALDQSGSVKYRREPFDPHGAQNFTDQQYWHKVRMSFDRDSGVFQTDNFIGIVGDKGQRTKAHISVNPDGEIVFVRDIGGEVLYSRKDGIGKLPLNLDWSK
jgi:hypothetical protein